MSDPATYTVGWICALVTEYVAARLFLDEEHPCPEGLASNDTNKYCLGTIRDHKVVIAVLPDGEYGTASAANVATNLLHSFPNVRIGLMVGIGGGAPNPPKNDIRLGDVVVSAPRNGETGIFQYDFGKILQDKPFQNSRVLNQPPTVLRTAMAGLQGEYEINGHSIEEAIEAILRKSPKLRKKYGKPPLQSDMLFKSSCAHEENCAGSDSCICVTANLVERPERDEDELLQIHYGLIASSNQLMKDATVRDRLAGQKDILCFEMEAAGLANHFPCIAIRGICDYSDSHKNKKWQGYAALAAAAYAKDLLLQVVPSGVESETRISVALCKVLDSSSKMQKEVQNVASQIHSDQTRRILNWLSETTFGAQQSDYLARRAEGTGTWLLQSSRYQHWYRTAGEVLFCPGNPGSGKTVLTSVIVEDLGSRFRGNNTVALAYIFFNYRREYTMVELLASLLRQFCSCGTSIPPEVIELYDKHASRGTRPQAQEVMDGLEKTSKLYQRVFLVVDALDEWKQPSNWQGHSDLLVEMLYLNRSLSVNLLVTSRPLPMIYGRFARFPTVEIIANEEDVGRYVDHNLRPLLALIDISLSLLQEIKIQIVEASQGMFLLAYLYLRSFKDLGTPREVIMALDKVKHKNTKVHHRQQAEVVDEAYDEALERIHSGPERHSMLADRVLAWITCATRPLLTNELQYALAVDPYSDTFDHGNIARLDLLTSVCCGLVTIEVESGIIRLVHYTTQQYFERKRSILFQNFHDTAALTCAAYLRAIALSYDFSRIPPTYKTLTEARKFLDIVHSYQKVDAYRTACRGEEPTLAQTKGLSGAETDCLVSLARHWASPSKYNPFYDYSALNWAFHLSKTRSDDIAQVSVRCLQEASAAVPAERSWRLRFEYYDDTTGLHLAARYGLTNCLPFLSQTVPLTETDICKRTPLACAAMEGQEAAVRWLLNQGASPNSFHETEAEPLSVAVKGQHYTVVIMLLEAGARVSWPPNHYTDSPLHVAAETGNVPIMQALMQADASIELPNSRDFKPIHQAARCGNDLAVEILVKWGAQVDARGFGNETSLSLAAKNGHIATVRKLIAYCASVHGRDAGDDTVLHAASAFCNNNEVLEVLIDAGADIHATHTARGSTPLYSAAIEGNISSATYLISRGANVNHQDRIGETPLSGATERGLEDMMRLLIDSGAKVDPEDCRGDGNIWTPLDHAWTRTALEILLSHGVNVNRRSIHGPPRLIYEARRGRLEYIQLLAAHGADMNVQTDDGIPVLSLAARVLSPLVVKELLRCGSGVDHRDGYGRTALMCAIKSHRPDNARALLENGARLDCKDDLGQTALHYMMNCGGGLCSQRPFTAFDAEYHCRDLWHSLAREPCGLDDIHALIFNCGSISQLLLDRGHLDEGNVCGNPPSPKDKPTTVWVEAVSFEG